MAEEFTDWRGNPVRPGDTVLYPSMSGRSCQMTEGVLLDIWRSCRDDDWKWKRLEVDEPAPTKLVWENVQDANGKPILEDGVYIRRQVEQSDFEWRAQIQPIRDSRFSRGHWGQETDEPYKVVTLTIVENITLLEAAKQG